MTTEGRPKPAQESQQPRPLETYIPLDPEEELKKLVAKRKTIGAIADESEKTTKRTELSSQIREIERQTLEQRLAIAKLINQAYELINQNPELSEVEFMGLVTEAAPQARLPQWIINTFQRKYYEYQSHHKSVHRYVETYRTPEALFEACFGSSPVGQIKWVIGPMTIDFQCFSEKDFFTIYNNGKSQPTINPEIGGCAVRRCNISDLNNCIIAENLSYNKKGGEQRKIIFDEIPPGQRIALNRETQSYRTRGNNQRRLVEVNYQTQAGESQPILASIGIYEYDNHTQLSLNQQTESQFHKGQSLGSELPVNIPISNDGSVYCAVDWDSGEIHIVNNSPDDWKCVHDLIYDKPNPTEIMNPKFSAETQAHENLHQWNRLFAPTETLESIPSIIGKYPNIESVADPRLFTLYCEYFIRQRKDIFIDQMARDEILAFYHEGYTPTKIAENLKTEIYDYTKEKLYTDQEQTMRLEIDYYLLMSKNKNPRMPHPSEIDPAIKESAIQYAFQTDYHTQIANWTNAITQLEVAGLPRETILAILYQEPASHWGVTARRYAKYSKPENPTLGNLPQ